MIDVERFAPYQYRMRYCIHRRITATQSNKPDLSMQDIIEVLETFFHDHYKCQRKVSKNLSAYLRSVSCILYNYFVHFKLEFDCQKLDWNKLQFNRWDRLYWVKGDGHQLFSHFLLREEWFWNRRIFKRLVYISKSCDFMLIVMLSFD